MAWQTLLEVLRNTTSKGAEYGFGLWPRGFDSLPRPKEKPRKQVKVAQELPSNPSSAVTREQPGENAVTGRREYVVMQKHIKQESIDDTKRRFESALRARFITDLFNL